MAMRWPGGLMPANDGAGLRQSVTVLAHGHSQFEIMSPIRFLAALATITP